MALQVDLRNNLRKVRVDGRQEEGKAMKNATVMYYPLARYTVCTTCCVSKGQRMESPHMTCAANLQPAERSM